MSSRTINSKNNIYSGIIYQIINVLLNIISRRIFILVFGANILGVNGVLQNVIAMLSLTELGIGIAISQSLYAPLAKGNYDQVNSIMHLYSKLYRIIGVIVAIIGICIFPILKYVVNTNVNNSTVYCAYILMLFDTSASYCFAYRQNLLIANQKKYIINIILTVSVIILNGIQIVAMLMASSYILFLSIKLLWDIGQNIFIYLYTGKKHSFINQSCKPVDKEYKMKLVTNVKALLIANISTYMIFSTDNIVLSVVCGTIAVGLYSNYAMIITSVKGMISQIFQGITASLGNYVVEKEKDETLKLFYNIYFINYWIATFCATCLFVLLNRFINLWIGENYILDMGVVALLVWNFYSDMMRSTIEVVRNATGLYSPYPFFKYWMLLEAVINISVSVVLGYKIGIYGVFIGTAISGIVSCYIIPKDVFRFIFDESSKKFYCKYIYYQIQSIIVIFSTWAIANIVNLPNKIVEFVIAIIISVVLPNIIIILFNFRKTEFKYVFNRFLRK